MAFHAHYYMNMMASSINHHLLISFFFLFSLLFLNLISPANAIAKTSFQPRQLVLPVTKDPSSLQYLTHINQRTPLVPLTLTVDLGGQFLWVDCDQGYVSSSYRPVRCGSALCKLSPSPSCNKINNTCSLMPDNTLTRTSADGELAQDILSIQSTDGRVVLVPRFPLICGPTFLLKGLAIGADGMAGLGRTSISLPSQLSAAFSFPPKFAMCLSSSTRSNGVIFFGDGPYVLLPNVDVSKSLIYTPLIKNPVSTASSYFPGEPSAEYFIGVESININGKAVPLNPSLLSINKKGNRGTKISTVNPYTVMETSIYKAFTQAFIKQLAKVPRVAPVAPFEVCFNSKSIGSTQVGPAVPVIDLVLQSESVYWRIFGANSMVKVSETVLCLGFVDGGVNPRTSIVIGGHQVEDNLLQFDLANSRLGFSSSLLLGKTTCANFNFKPKA